MSNKLIIPSVVATFMVTACQTLPDIPMGPCAGGKYENTLTKQASCLQGEKIQNFLESFNSKEYFIGGLPYNNILLAEGALRLRVANGADPDIIQDFRQNIIDATPDGQKKIDLAGDILDARERGMSTMISGEDMNTMGIENTGGVLIITPDITDDFISPNNGQSDLIAERDGQIQPIYNVTTGSITNG